MKTNYKREYHAQCGSAKRRGIEWLFTYESWLAFWGSDIESRGKGHDRLCMQRFGDTGPYSPDNVKKGYAMENARTAGVVKRGKNAADNAKTKQSADDWAAVHEAFFPKGN